MKKIAILNVGLDKIKRGYETHTRLFFNSLIDESLKNYEFTLYKNTGKKKHNEVVLNSPFRYGRLCLSLGRVRGNHLYWESLLFALYFIVHTNYKRKKYNTIWCIEPMVLRTLYKLKFLLPGKPKFIFTHGVNNPPERYYYITDKIHQVNIENYINCEKYIQHNHLENKQVLIPHFLKEKYDHYNIAEIKRKYRIQTKNVLFSVGAIENTQKRMGYIIDEFEKLDMSWTLLIAGVATDKELFEIAQNKYGDRFVNIQVKNSEMNSLYQVSNLVVVASLNEGFGMSIIEAMSNNTPVVLHNRKLFEWILKDNEYLIDMTKKGELSSFVRSRTSEDFRLKGVFFYKVFTTNYTWESVKKKYLSLLD